MKFLVLLALVAVAFAAPSWHQLESSGYSFDDFLHEFGNTVSNVTDEYWMRKEIFEANLEKIMEHNRNPTATWKLAVNKFADRTEQEMKQMMGYHKGMGFQSRAASANSITYNKQVDLSALPKSVDWREKGCVTPVKDQGRCGSCWTFGSAEAIESHHCIKTGKLFTLSEQQIASCTSNPKHCGGTGGCGGGTSEVAFQSVIDRKGITSEWKYPYISYQGQDYDCKINPAQAEVKLSSYVQLPMNEYAPLMDAIANIGPIAVSVDASAWSFYTSGIFDGCNQTQPDVNHLVLLTGYGTENGIDYWTIRNSWSPNWGEDGYIRIRRVADEQSRCAMDKTPEHGSGCDGGPKEMLTCGTCGILFDNAYPVIA